MIYILSNSITSMAEMASRDIIITTTLITTGIAVLTLLYWVTFKRQPHKTVMRPRKKRDEVKDMKWEPAGRVAKLRIYPVKSCSGITVPSAQTDLCGLMHAEVVDRSFVICNYKGAMITARMIPSMLRIHPSIEDNVLTLKYPGVEDLTVDLSQVKKTNEIVAVNIWTDKTSGLCCGEEASSWLHAVLGRRCRLLYHADFPSPRTADIRNIEKYPLLRDDDHFLYTDGAAFMLMTVQSVADLQRRVQCQIAAENFRPTILIEAKNGPYDEDSWEYVMIGEAVFRNISPCTRCIFTTIDHETGHKDPNQEPLRTLKTLVSH